MTLSLSKVVIALFFTLPFNLKSKKDPNNSKILSYSTSVANRSPLVDVVVATGETPLLVVFHDDIIALLQADLDNASTHQSSP